MSEKPSRQLIIESLKKAEWMTVAELSKYVNITPMAVRQHLLALERQGIVRYTVNKTGIGRPVYMYRLTERAENIFPKSYGKFLNELLSTIEDVDGRNKLERLLGVMTEKSIRDRSSALAELEGVEDRVHTLAEMLNQEGYMIELEEADGGFNMSQFNCPLSEVSSCHPVVCKYELDMYRELLGADVQRTQWHHNGNASCQYFIPYSVR